MADTISNLHLALYDTFTTNLSQGNRRSAEENKNDLLKSLLQTVEWCLASIEGAAARQSAALTELGVIYTNSIIPPTNSIPAVTTELNTRKGVAVAITAGENIITFPSLFETGYGLTNLNCYTSTGAMIQHSQDPDTRTAIGFTLYAAAAGFVDYLAYK